MELQETWDLEGIFAGGSRSPEFADFLARLDAGIETLAGQVAALGEEPGDWSAAVSGWQQRAAELGQAYSFVECLAAADTGDAVATQLGGRLDAVEARLKSIEVEIDKRLLALPDDTWQRLLEQEPLASVAFFLDRQRAMARHKMDPRRETLAETLAVNGYHAWGRMYDKLAGSLRATVTEDGQQVELSIGQLVHRLEDADGAVRGAAFGHLEEAWRGVQDLAAMALNSQAGFRQSLYAGRGWQSVLWEPLHLNRLRPETLQAMWSAIAAKSAALLPYLEAKARLLNIDRMRWADLIAPVANSDSRFDYPAAADYIVQRFAAFGGELGEFARHAFARRWIEVEDRPGKAAGGFCTDLPLSRQTRIFMTYGGTFGGATTLAHELGHAYHAWLLRERPYFATHYPMALAETASTFCETLIMDAALDAAERRAGTGAARQYRRRGGDDADEPAQPVPVRDRLLRAPRGRPADRGRAQRGDGGRRSARRTAAGWPRMATIPCSGPRSCTSTSLPCRSTTSPTCSGTCSATACPRSPAARGRASPKRTRGCCRTPAP